MNALDADERVRVIQTAVSLPDEVLRTLRIGVTVLKVCVEHNFTAYNIASLLTSSGEDSSEMEVLLDATASSCGDVESDAVFVDEFRARLRKLCQNFVQMGIVGA